MRRTPGVFPTRRKAFLCIAPWAALGVIVYLGVVVFAGFLWHEADAAGRRLAAATRAATEAQP